MKRYGFLYLLKFYVVTVLLFVVAKVVFVLCCGSDHGVAFSDMLAVIGHGLSLDLSTALYFLIVPFLISFASLWVRVPRWVERVYYAVIAVAFALAFVADTSLYPFWGFKLDASCLQYLEQPEGITQSVSVGYLVLRVVLIIVLSIGIYKLYIWTHPQPLPEGRGAVRKATEMPDNKSICPPPSQGGARGGSLSSRVVRIALYIICIPLFVIGIRGGLGESTTNIGQVYYSQNQFLNHAAVNPVFSFLYSLGHGLGDLSQYDFMDENECQQLTENVYTTASIDTDTLLRTQRPNIVIILLESAGEQFANAMPRLQQLKQEGVNFTRCYANSWRTDRGTICTLSGYPSFPSVSVMKMPQKSRKLPSIARTLRNQGYKTSYLYGGDINFTNMRSYLIATGWEKLTSMDDYSAADRGTAQWGVRDDITFKTIEKQITDTGNGGQRTTDNGLHTPVLIGYSTLSSHEPWDVPEKAEGGKWNESGDEVHNAFAYVDECLATFINNVRATPAWDSLLVVITADHGINYKQIDQSQPLQKNHIPMLWLGGAICAPRVVEAICNQSDLAATLLGQLGLPHDDFLFSRDVLSKTYVYPTAVHNYNNAQWLIDSTGHILYDFDARRFIVKESPDAERLLRLNKAMLQCTTGDLRER